MGFEDDYNPSGTVTKVTRNLLGARGIDRISITENSSTTHGYPIYDGHGNCRGILTKNGTSYGTGNWRTYDVWGSVRSGSATGDPKSRYVASIGHVADDESSLIYMRARYYEPATGRFLSEDPAMDGVNWYIYGNCNPIRYSDYSGRNAVVRAALQVAIELRNLYVLAVIGTAVILKFAYQYVALVGMAIGAAAFADSISPFSSIVNGTVMVLANVATMTLPDGAFSAFLHKLGFKDWTSKITAGKFGIILATNLAYVMLIYVALWATTAWSSEP